MYITVLGETLNPPAGWQRLAVVAFRLLYKLESFISNPSVLSFLFNLSVSKYTFCSVESALARVDA